MNYNSDFKYDLKLGVIGEKYVGDLFSNKKLEVKTDYQAHRTGNVFVEYESRNKKSGVSTTEADFYVFILSNDHIIFVSVNKLKQLCRMYINTKRDIKGGDNNTSKGILLPIEDLIKVTL